MMTFLFISNLEFLRYALLWKSVLCRAIKTIYGRLLSEVLVYRTNGASDLHSVVKIGV